MKPYILKNIILGVVVAALMTLNTVMGFTSLSGINDTALVSTYAAASQPPPDTSECAKPGTPKNTWYVMAYQCGNDIKGVSASATVPNPPPRIDECNGEHSNAQITLEDSHAGQRNAIEVSWAVNRNFGNTDNVYLQIGRTIGSQDATKDYPSIAWTPYPSADNPNLPQPLQTPSYWDRVKSRLLFEDPDDKARKLARITKSPINLQIHYAPPSETHTDDGQWQVWIDGKEIGYYPDKKTFGPSGFHPKRAEWWGEVAATGACATTGTLESCTAMGNGKLGSDPSATEFTNMTIEGGTDKSARYIYATDPALYGSDKYSGPPDGSAPLDTDAFKYGGPGNCPTTGIPHPVVIPPQVIPPQTGTGFIIPPDGGNNQKHCDSGQDLINGLYCVTKQQPGCEAGDYRCFNNQEICRPDQERDHRGHCYNNPTKCDHNQYWDHGQCKLIPECDHNQVADGHGGCKDKPMGDNECRHDQVRDHDGKCYAKPKDCPHGQVRGPHGECSDIPNNGSQGSGSNDSCPNGMVRVSPETDTTSGCVLPGRKQQDPQKQEQPQKQGNNNPQKQENSQKQDHPNKQEKKAEPNQQTNHNNGPPQKTNAGQSDSGQSNQKKKCDPHQEKCPTQR